MMSHNINRIEQLQLVMLDLFPTMEKMFLKKMHLLVGFCLGTL